LRDRSERLLFVCGGAFHRGDDVRDEVVAALELRVDVGPGPLADLIFLNELVVLRAGARSEREGEERNEE
jgi:hypothetical protein